MSTKGLSMMRFDINTESINGLGQSLEIALTAMKDPGSIDRNLLNEIGQEGVAMARSYLRSNNTIDTGRLSKSVEYRVKKGQLKLTANAIDKRGRPYGGYIEYGYTDRGGHFRGPWPFLRPALQMMVLATRGNLGNSAAAMLQGLGGTGLLSASSGRIGLGSKNIGRIYGNRSNASRDRYSRTGRRGFYSTDKTNKSNAWKGVAGRSQAQQQRWANSSRISSAYTKKYTG